MNKSIWMLGAALIAAPALAKPRFAAEISRTAHGIPHISARDFAGLGYGVAYAYAEDNLCLLAEEFATVAGTRSLHFGPEAKAVLGFQEVDNLASDLFFRAVIDVPALRAGARRLDRPVRDLIRGYVAGYNRRLRDLGPDDVPAECRGKAWVGPITEDDMLRLNEKQMLLAGSLAFAPAIAAAAPPAAASPAQTSSIDIPSELGIGSNGWAFGAEATADRRGLVIGNPHFPWNGPSRFWQMHATIPGRFDVMGAGIAGSPFPTLGFNRDVAWTHTVTAARHFTIHALSLDPDDPTAYFVDGRRETMGQRSIEVPLAGGEVARRTLYTSRYGPLVVAPAAGLGWTSSTAYALKEANRLNQRALSTWLGIATARSVADVRRAVETSLGIPWVNTIAADRHGDALLADVTAVPNVTPGHVTACATPLSPRVAARFVLLDGSRSACDWLASPGTPVPGLMPATDQAVVQRRDWVLNANDSYWLTTPKAPYQALSPILGAHATARSLRTRSGLIETEAALAAGPMTPARAREMAFANRSLAADLLVPALLALCPEDPALAPACAALSGWDRRFEAESRGALLFHHAWPHIEAIKGLWATPFNLGDPVNTPRDPVASGPQGEALKAALRTALAEIAAAGLTPDARWGDVHFAPRAGSRIPIHGGDGVMGVLNVQRSVPAPGGHVPVHGTSYVQVVGFSDDGPVADALLSYSQSTNPASPWYADQTRLYATKNWVRLPFTPAEIEAARVGGVVRLEE